MPEERICPVCGRSNALANAQCTNCGRSVSSGGSMLLLQEEEQTIPDVGARLRTSTIPVPPQIRAEWEREEIARRDREIKEAARKAAVEAAVAAAKAETEKRQAIEARFQEAEEEAEKQRLAAERTESLARRGATILRCGTCGTRTDAAGEGVEFSFCAVCGADLPRNGIPVAGEVVGAQTAVQPAPGEKARSYREQMNERRARYAATAAAASTGRTARRTTSGGTRTRSKTVPVGPAAFSFFLPGGGQMVNGQIGKGIFILLAYLFAMSALNIGAWGILMLIARVLVALDAYRIAERRNRGDSVREWEWDIQD